MTSDADTSAKKEKVFHGCVPPVFLPEVHLSAPFYIAHGQKIGIAGLFLPGTSCAIARETFFSQHHPKTMAAREGWFPGKKVGSQKKLLPLVCPKTMPVSWKRLCADRRREIGKWEVFSQASFNKSWGRHSETAPARRRPHCHYGRPKIVSMLFRK